MTPLFILPEPCSGLEADNLEHSTIWRSDWVEKKTPLYRAHQKRGWEST